MTLVFREDDPAPDTTGVFEDPDSLRMDRGGRALYFCRLGIGTGGVTSAGDTGLRPQSLAW